MRTKLLTRRPGALADYELLEMILFLGIERRDTKPLAKATINRFGSLAVNRRGKGALTQPRCTRQDGAMCRPNMPLPPFRRAYGVRCRAQKGHDCRQWESNRPLIPTIVATCTEIASEPFLDADRQVGFDGPIEAAPTLETALLAAAERMLAVALQDGGTADGVMRIVWLLHAHQPVITSLSRSGPARLRFLAQQFQTLVLSGPQSWAVGLGEPLSPDACADWCRDSVALFLRGAQA